MPRRKRSLFRERKPFFHVRLQCWYFWQFKGETRVMTRLTPRGKRTTKSNSADKAEALKRWHELCRTETPEDKPSAKRTDTVQAVIAKFMDWLNAQPDVTVRTRKWYRGWLVGRYTKKDGSKLPKSPTEADLKDAIPHTANNAFGPYVKLLRIGELEKSHFEGWLSDKLSSATSNGRLGALKAARRFVRWAIDEGYIRANPMKGIKFPRYIPRDVRISDDEWQSLLTNASPEFGEFLRLLRATGMRPFELRQVEARHLVGQTVVFDVVESKGKKWRRSLPLNNEAFTILSRLAAERPEGTLLRNASGRPWRGDTLSETLLKLREKIWGEGEKTHLTPYAIRHEFVSTAIQKGTDVAALVKICGWRDQTMLHKVYGHVDTGSDYMLQQVAKATGEA